MTRRIECVTGGERLDIFLSESIAGLTRSGAQKLITGGGVTLGTAAALSKSYKVSAGEVFDVSIDEPESIKAQAQDIPLDVIYEDSDVIAVNKPRGMVVHPAPGHAEGTLVNALLMHCGDSLSGIGGQRRPGIVHRIDKDTSGLIIAAKNDAAHIALSEQLSRRTLKREYEAVVCGAVKDGGGTVNAPIGRHPTDRKRQAVTEKNSRTAVTHYEVLGRYNGYTHIRCRLETGRTHQIRVHMAHIGHPVLGDLVYGRKKAEKGISGQCLHARKLEFIHPSINVPVTLETKLPEYFVQVLKRLGKELGL